MTEICPNESSNRAELRACESESKQESCMDTQPYYTIRWTFAIRLSLSRLFAFTQCHIKKIVQLAVKKKKYPIPFHCSPSFSFLL